MRGRLLDLGGLKLAQVGVANFMSGGFLNVAQRETQGHAGVAEILPQLAVMVLAGLAGSRCGSALGLFAGGLVVHAHSSDFGIINAVSIG